MQTKYTSHMPLIPQHGMEMIDGWTSSQVGRAQKAFLCLAQCRDARHIRIINRVVVASSRPKFLWLSELSSPQYGISIFFDLLLRHPHPSANFSDSVLQSDSTSSPPFEGLWVQSFLKVAKDARMDPPGAHQYVARCCYVAIEWRNASQNRCLPQPCLSMWKAFSLGSRDANLDVLQGQSSYLHERCWLR